LRAVPIRRNGENAICGNSASVPGNGVRAPAFAKPEKLTGATEVALWRSCLVAAGRKVKKSDSL
jgi:hypothetical protein